MNIIFGAQYKSKLTQQVVVLLGVLSSTVVVENSSGEVEKILKPTFFDEFEETGVHDHEKFCCSAHGMHTVPHKGCIFR